MIGPLGILGRRDLIENEEFEIDVIEDAIEAEHCYNCDEEFTAQQGCSSQRTHICDNLKFLNRTILILFAL